MALQLTKGLSRFGLFLALFTVFSLFRTASAHLEVDYDYLGLKEGDIIGSTNLSDPDIYIINELGFKRLFLSPTIFGFYGHLKFPNVKRIDDAVLDKIPTSGLFRNCETPIPSSSGGATGQASDQKVYALEVTGEDAAILRWVNITGEAAVAEDHDFFSKVFCVNSREFSWYSKGQAYTALSQAPVYTRTALLRSINETNMPLVLPAGFKISLFTPKIGPLRFMAFSPDGILFVSMPSSKGLYVENRPDDGKIFALPDKDNNGLVDEVKTVLSGLHVPHGIAFYNGYLYLAEEDKVSRYLYLNDGKVGSREVIASLPSGGEHVSRTIGFSKAGKMYVSVGSACNVCTTGEGGTAAIWEFNADGTGGRVFARGLRNAVGFVFHPTSGEIWATENGRDLLGDDLPPDEINIVQDSKNYGWPYCYGKNLLDPFGKDIPGSVCLSKAASHSDLQAHSAPLGLRFVTGSQFLAWSGDFLVARHGSWNRSQPVGYDVVRLDVENNMVVGEYPFITGWLTAKNEKLGKPVDVIFGPDGSLYISDDKANLIYKVTKI